MSSKEENCDTKTLVVDGDLKVGIPTKEALNTHRWSFIVWGLMFILSLGLMSYSFSFEKNPDDKQHAEGYASYTVWRFFGYHLFMPFSIYCFLQLCAAFYSVFALTRTSVRYVYIDVFYLTPVMKMLGIAYCTYMLVFIFTPHYFYISGSNQLWNFPIEYLVVAGIVFSYDILDDVLVLSYILALRLKKIKIVKFLNKYYWVRSIFHMLMNFLVAGYYIYSIIENGFGYGHFRLTMPVLCVGSGLAIAFRLHRKMFVPKTLTLKEDLNDKKVPENVKIQTAMKIVKMKEDVKAVAAASA